MASYISMRDGKVVYSNTPTLETALAENEQLKGKLESIVNMIQIKNVLDAEGQKTMNDNINLMVKGLFR